MIFWVLDESTLLKRTLITHSEVSQNKNYTAVTAFRLRIGRTKVFGMFSFVNMKISSLFCSKGADDFLGLGCINETKTHTIYSFRRVS